jgi:hypothetical protein
MEELAMARRIAALLLVVLVLFSSSITTAGEVFSPPLGTSERRDILDAVRNDVAADLPRPVKFLVHQLKVKDGWAFLAATPQQPDGRPYDYRGTQYEEFIKKDLFDDNLFALLELGQSRWHVRALVIGATDVPYGGWSQEYGAPPEIFE